MLPGSVVADAPTCGCAAASGTIRDITASQFRQNSRIQLSGTDGKGSQTEWAVSEGSGCDESGLHRNLARNRWTG